MFKLSRRSYDRLTGVDPVLIHLVERAIKTTKVDFGIAFLGGRRSPLEQHKLFTDGFSTKDGFAKRSKHQSGMAFDVIPFVDGRVAQNQWNYAMVVSAILIKADELGLNVRSGTNWDMDNTFLEDQTFQDYGHIELVL